MRWLDGITDTMDMNSGILREMVRMGRPGVLQSISHKESDTTGQLNNNLFCHGHWGLYIFKS